MNQHHQLLLLQVRGRRMEMSMTSTMKVGGLGGGCGCGSTSYSRSRFVAYWFTITSEYRVPVSNDLMFVTTCRNNYRESCFVEGVGGWGGR